MSVGTQGPGDAGEGSSGRCLRGIAGSGWAFVVFALVVVGARFGSPYDQLHRAVTQVISRRGVEAATALLAAYPRPDANEISDVAFELTLVPAGE